MATIVGNNIIQHRVISQDGSARQYGYNVFHYNVEAVAGTPTTDAEVLTFLNAFWAPKFKTLMSNKAQYYGSDLQVIHPLPLTLRVSTTALQGLGDLDGDQLPSQVATLFTLRTARAGRKYRGRKYIPFCGEEASGITGLPTPAFIVICQAFAVHLSTVHTVPNTAATGTVTLAPVLWHRTPRNFDQITVGIARSFWGTQRRRSDVNRNDTPPF